MLLYTVNELRMTRAFELKTFHLVCFYTIEQVNGTMKVFFQISVLLGCG